MQIHPDDIEISKNLQKIADLISKELYEITGHGVGFSLVVFNSEDNSRMNYVSNVCREEAADGLLTLLNAWAQDMPDIPAHEIQ